jgi:predicted acylesterase/phospholipase RssA
MMASTRPGSLRGKAFSSRTAVLCVVLLAAWAAAGCTTQNCASLVHPCCGDRFQECPIRLGAYRSVQERTGGQDPNLALAVAISGGGHRAGNFGAGVLLGLEEILRHGSPERNALREVDYLSTVSGGGLTAAAFVSSLHDYRTFRGTIEGYSFAEALRGPRGTPPPLQQQWTDPDLRKNLEYNYVDDILRGMFAVATFGYFHRGDFLERSFDDHVLGRRWRERKLASLGEAGGNRSASLRLRDVFVARDDARREVRLPYWVANATTYENAAVFPFTPDHLRLYQVCGYRHRLREVRHDSPAEGYEEFLADAPLALGMTASGTYPVLIPASTLNSRMDRLNPYLHLLDGGLADMFGAVTAWRLLRQEAVARRKVLLVVDAYKGPLTPFSCCQRPPAMLTTACRVATAFVDAWRSRYHEVIRALGSARNPPSDIEAIFLSFDDLEPCKDMKALEPFGFGPRDLERLKREGISPGMEITPFTLARDVWTWYNLSPTEQKLLFAVGRYVVHRKRGEIRKAIGWEAR